MSIRDGAAGGLAPDAPFRAGARSFAGSPIVTGPLAGRSTDLARLPEKTGRLLEGPRSATARPGRDGRRALACPVEVVEVLALLEERVLRR